MSRKFKKRSHPALFLGLTGISFLPYCHAADSWTLELIPQTWYGSYQSSLTRDSVLSFGIYASADYLDKSGFTIGYNRSDVTGKTVATDIIGPDIEESAGYLSGYYSTFPDALPGKLTFRLDGYSVMDKSIITETTVIPGGGMGGNDRVITDSTTYTDNIVAGYAEMAFIDYSEKYYFDIGYAFSSYDYDAADVSRDNDVQQFTPTVGLAINEGYDWLQARGYFIQLQHGDNTNGKTSSNAIELQWIHWYGPLAFLGLHSIGIHTVIGERMYAVDPEAGEINSLADRQNSSYSLLMSWKLVENLEFTTVVGYDQYTEFFANLSNTIPKDEYSIVYGYFNLAISW